MMIALAALVGIAAGSLPTADWLGRRQGLDLRASGSGNPGTNNALHIGGPRLAVPVLIVEIVKGGVAVLAGHPLGGDLAAAFAGIGATAGNVYNPWFRGRGGKGLAITGGVAAVSWPLLAVLLLGTLALGAFVMRGSGPATLITLAIYAAAAVLGTAYDLPGHGLLTDSAAILALAAGQIAVLAPKHLADTFRRGDPLPSPG